MLISDWSSDVCSSDLGATLPLSGSGQVVNRLAGDEAARLLRLATTASVVTAVLLILVKLVAFLLTDSVSILSTLIDSLLDGAASLEIGRAHVCPVTNAHLVCRLLLEKKKTLNDHTD